MKILWKHEGQILTMMVAATFILLATSGQANARIMEQKHSVPFKATGHGNAIAVSGPPIIEIFVYGSGQATHMGRVSIWQHHYVNVTSMTFYDGEWVWTAANGDKLMGTYYGSLVAAAEGFEIHGQFAITGGTGRFANAVGGGIASGMQYYIDNTADLKLDGRIMYGSE
jgi:hypothetical protein